MNPIAPKPPAGIRVFVPVVALVLGTALSCGMACFVPMVAGAAAGSAAIAGASSISEKNRTAKLAALEAPAVTAEPRTIKRALREALGEAVAHTPNGDVRLEVVQTATTPGAGVYEITVVGDFTPGYSQALGDFANRLRKQLPAGTKFVIHTFKATGGGDRQIARMEIN